MSTVAEAWMQQGEARGRAETLLRLLERRFGAVPESVRTWVAERSASEVDAWLGAPSLEAVFGDDPAY